MSVNGFETGLNSFGEVATDDLPPRWRHWQPVARRLAKERGFHEPDRGRYEAEREHGALFVRSPETVARKIATVARDPRLSRFDLKYDIMRLPRQARARTIELPGGEVAPRVREILSKESAHV